MTKYFSLLLSLCIWTSGLPIFSQISFGGKPINLNSITELRSTSQSHIIKTDNIDDMKIRAEWLTENGAPRIVGRAINANLDLIRDGELISFGTNSIYTLKIKSPGASAICIGYEKFKIPKGGKLFIYNKAKTEILGAYTERTNPQGGRFTTDFIQGDEIILQYESATNESPEIRLHHIGYMFSKDFLRQTSNYPKVSANEWGSGYCQVNIGCPEGKEWQNTSRGIVQIYQKLGDNYAQCSGTLLNNTNQDFTPYIITAAHCAMTGQSDSETNPKDYDFWIFRFNYRRNSCANNESVKPYAFTMVGAERCCFLSIIGKSDGLLLKLKQPIPSYYGVYYNGWDRRDISDTYSINGAHGLHHPHGDVMKISTYTDKLKSATWTEYKAGVANKGAKDAHFVVKAASTESGHSVTEPGSSGSGLFNDEKHLLVGTLSGGVPTCYQHINANIYYGKLSAHWNKFKTEGDANSSMDIYLDPKNHGQAMECPGIYKSGDALLQTPSDFKLQNLSDNEAILSWAALENYPSGANLTLIVEANKEKVKRIEIPITATEYRLPLNDLGKGTINLSLQAMIGNIGSIPSNIGFYRASANLIGEKAIQINPNTTGVDINWSKPNLALRLGPTDFKDQLPYIANKLDYVDGTALNLNRLYFGIVYNGTEFRQMDRTYVVGIRAIAPKSPGLCQYAIYLRNGVTTNSDQEGDYLIDTLAAPSAYREIIIPKKGNSKNERLKWQTFYLAKPFLISPNDRLIGALEMTSKNKFDTDVIAMAPQKEDGSDHTNVFSFDGLRWLSNSEQTIASDVVGRGMAFQLILSNDEKYAQSSPDSEKIPFSTHPITWPKIKKVEIYRDGILLETLPAEVSSYHDASGSSTSRYEVRFVFTDGSSSVANIKKIKSNKTIRVYPTTTNDKVYISPCELIRKMRLYDLNGNLLEEHTNCPAEITLANYPIGNYLLTLTDNCGKSQTIKLTRQK